MSKTEEKTVPPKAIHPVRPADIAKVDTKKLRERIRAKTKRVRDALAK